MRFCRIHTGNLLTAAGICAACIMPMTPDEVEFYVPASPISVVREVKFSPDTSYLARRMRTYLGDIAHFETSSSSSAVASGMDIFPSRR